MKITKKLATKLHEGTRREKMGSWEDRKKREEKIKKICVICITIFQFLVFSARFFLLHLVKPLLKSISDTMT